MKKKMPKIHHERIAWVDIAKGIAIILMILGHSNIPMLLSNWIFAFHMPLFFLVSGLMTNWRIDNGGPFTLNKSKSILFPFIIYSAIILIFNFLLNIGIKFSVIEGWGGYAMWFIPVLFISLLIAKLIQSFDKRLQYLCIVCLPIIGTCLYRYLITFPWNLSIVPLATFFICIGALAQSKRDTLNQIPWYWGIIWFIISLSISLFWHLDMAWNQVTPIIPIIIGAVSGTLFITYVSYEIEKHTKILSKILQAVGRETYLILAFSQLVIMGINKYYDVNVLVKYVLLTIILIVIKYIKDTLKYLVLKLQ